MHQVSMTPQGFLQLNVFTLIYGHFLQHTSSPFSVFDFMDLVPVAEITAKKWEG